MSTGGKWSQRRAAPAYAPVPDLPLSGVCFSLGGIYSVSGRKWISDMTLFPSLLLLYVEQFLRESLNRN